MAKTRDIIIIGGGHNGLVAAFYLAKSGFKPLVLERRPVVGGAAITEEFHPGFRCSILAHCSGPLLPEVAKDMNLEVHGLRMIHSEPRVFAPSVDGHGLLLYSNPAKSSPGIAMFSEKDVASYVEFQRNLACIAALMKSVLSQPPPLIDNPSAGDLWNLLKTAKQIRGLGKKMMFRLLRWGPMPIADLVGELFETEVLRATIAARAIFGTFLGPRSPGSSAALLLRAAADEHPAGATSFPKGGMGSLTQAMAAAAMQAGAEIRIGAEVSCISVKNGSTTGVVLANGDEIAAKAIISNADPQRTFLRLIDPDHLEPDFILRMQNYRCQGSVAKVNLALSALPRFTALGTDSNPTLATLGPAVKNGASSALAGRIHIGPEIDYLERAFDDAKYGNFSRQPILEITIPSLADPSLAPSGKHVMSIYVQYAPFKLKENVWAEQRDALGDTVVKTLSAYAPALPGLILHRQVITPHDLEESYSLTGGHIFHGELTLDQLFAMRPLLGWARYRTPIRGLFLCGSGTHPGTGLTGASGANAAREILKDLQQSKHE